MKVVSIACAGAMGVVGSLLGHAAQAHTIWNFEPYPHTITVSVSGVWKQLTIAPGQNVDVACDNECVVELESGEQYVLKGSALFSFFKNGTFYINTVKDD